MFIIFGCEEPGQYFLIQKPIIMKQKSPPPIKFRCFLFLISLLAGFGAQLQAQQPGNLDFHLVGPDFMVIPK
ncbi:MAG: hypothetical protein D6706_06820 [Chloroflexi bacterium]|nr:MAG: hypothetical protein D6706_06820 [Chloroflexota bacterium]